MSILFKLYLLRCVFLILHSSKVFQSMLMLSLRPWYHPYFLSCLHKCQLSANTIVSNQTIAPASSFLRTILSVWHFSEPYVFNARLYWFSACHPLFTNSDIFQIWTSCVLCSMTRPLLCTSQCLAHIDKHRGGEWLPEAVGLEREVINYSITMDNL